MDKQELVIKAKSLIAGSSVAEALELVKNYLQKDRKYRVLLEEALRISADYNRVKREADNDLITFDNARISFNQATDRLIRLLGYIETDNLQPEALKTPANSWQLYYRSHKWQLLTGIPTLLIALVLLVWALNNKSGVAEEGGVGITQQDCPFEGSELLNILLLRFYLPGGGDLSPEGLFAGQLESFCTENKIAADVEIMQKPKKPDRLMDYQSASDLGKLCQAKMVIWGLAEKSGGKAEIKTRYKYLGEQGDMAFSQIKWQGENALGAESTLSSLVSQGELTEDIEKVILLMEGVIASEADNSELALDRLESIATKDSTAILLKGMVQAENHLKQGDNAKALAAYDDVLGTHPDYWLAQNNRGILEMQTGQYLNAIEDISNALEKKPDNVNMLLALGKAYEKSDQLYPAKATYEKVISLKTNRTPEATKSLEATKIRISQQEKAIDRIEKKGVNRRTMQDTLTLLDAHRNLGENDKAVNLISKTRIIRPADPALIARQVESLLRQRKKEEAIKVVNDAVKRGVKKQDIVDKCRDLTVKKFILSN